MLRWRKNGRRMVYSVLGHAAGKGAELLEGSLRRPRAVPIIVLLVWACAVLPNLTLHSFIWEEGTNPEIARDVLAHGHFLVPIVYGIPWLEKPSLLPWLIAGVAAVTGQVNEWSARLPAMISVLLTALMVQGLTRRYASLQASLFAALCFLFAPLLLQKLAIAEPDTLITLLSFAAFLVWWNGIAAGGVSILRWIVCGLLLAALVMAKGPQPAGFFALGTATYLMVERRWRDLPGWLLCMIVPLAAAIAWGVAVYQTGVEATWLSYARLTTPPTLHGYIASNSYSAVSLILQMLPATLILPFVVSAQRQEPDRASHCAVALFQRLPCGLGGMAGFQRALCHADCASPGRARRNGMGFACKIKLFFVSADRRYDALRVDRLPARSGGRDYAGILRSLWRIAE